MGRVGGVVALRTLLGVLLFGVVIYTIPVLQNHGFTLFQQFFGDIAKMGWPGQFNVDFLGFLILSGTWVAWRHHFSPLGLGLSIFAFLGGIPFLATYLLIQSVRCDGDVATLLLGEKRRSAL